MSFADEIAAFRAAHPEIESVDAFITDLNGLARGKRMPVAQLDKLAKGGVKMPVSSVGLDVFGSDVAENAIAIERGDPDGALVPVPGSLAPMLWAARPVAQVACVMSETDGGPCAYDPRGVLARVAERAAGRGLTPVMALELEFYLVDPERPEPPVNPSAGGRVPRTRDQIYEMGTIEAFDAVISDIQRASQALGAPAETSICEFGPGQFEMNLGHVADPLAAADHMVWMKRAIRGCARAHGMDATFMPKPYGDASGSGMHVHVSLLDGEGQNLFDGGAAGPNAAMRHGLAGLAATMAEAMLVFAPHANSYRRFMPGSYAPMVAAWGHDNRGTALRLPETRGPGARIEHRVAGSDANPYLLTAAVLAGVLTGLEAGAEPPAPVGTEAGHGDGFPLPLSWDEALAAFAASDTMADWLGADFARIFAGMKRQERATLLARVPDTEYDAYLRVV